MSAITDNFFRDLANIVRPLSAPKPKPRGAYSATLTVDGLDIDVTYDIEGQDLRATAYDPSEREYATLVTAAIGCVDITPWSKRLGLDDALDDHFDEARYGGPDDFDYDRSKEEGAL